jgi:hypothetical protein
MTTGAVGILLASLLGSPHCAAMCGPFVAFYSGGVPASGSRLRAHAAYTTGRLAAYLALGAVAGSLGAALDRTGDLAGVSRLAAMAAGALMIAWGVSTIAAASGVRVAFLHAPRWLAPAVSRLLTSVRGRHAIVRAGVTGLATALLPCGWLYVFVAAAAGSGTPLRGAATMLVFWSGTLPVMLSLGLGLQRLTGSLRARLPIVTAIGVVLIGLFTIAGRFAAAPVGSTAQSALHEHRR